jgi:hypothetical protein
MFNILRLLGLKPNKEQKAETQDSSGRHIANANVVGRIFCLIFGHNKICNKCQVCKEQFGVPKMECPPDPP